MIWLETHFIWFVLYSVVGWIWEVIICSVPAKKFINRGFLNGPYCPIYGSGALLVFTVLGGIENVILLFIASALLTCMLEYITSFLMEKLFHTRWWDYSGIPFNINGRVCLQGVAAFGALSVIAIKLVHPFVERYTARLSESALWVTALVLFSLILIDIVYTVTRISEFDAKLKELTEKINNAVSAAKEQQKSVMGKIQDSEIYARFIQPGGEFFNRINFQDRRIIKAFPKLRSVKYNDTLKKIKQYVLEIGKNKNKS